MLKSMSLIEVSCFHFQISIILFNITLPYEQKKDDSRSAKFRNSHSVIPNQKSQTKTEPILEIRNVQLNSENGRTTPQQHSSSMKPDESIADHTTKLNSTNLSTQHIDLNRTAFDYMPKYVLRQINEKRLINTNGVSNSNGLVYMPSTSTTVMTPYALYNTKTQYENIVDNAARDLNRKSNKNTKIQAQLLQKQQQQNLNQMPQQGSNTLPQNLQPPQPPILQGNSKNGKIFSAYSTNVSSNGSTKDKNESGYDIRGNLSKVNEEFLNTLATNINLASTNANLNGNNLFSSAFMHGLPLKAQYEKITTRAASTSNTHNHQSNANVATVQTARPKISK